MSGSGETFVADPDYEGVWTYEMRVKPIVPESAAYTMISTRQNSYVNSDIIAGDPNLKNVADGDVFFENFLRGSKIDLEGLADGVGQRYDTSDGDLWSTMYGDGVAGIVWVDTSPTSGEWSANIGNGETLGTSEAPVILIIDGDFITTGAPGLNLVGLLYVTGDWDTAGNINIQGMVIVEGVIVAGNGGPTVIFDPTLFQPGLGSTQVGATGMVPGSWKDWRN